jgi:hypothetical protein
MGAIFESARLEDPKSKHSVTEPLIIPASSNATPLNGVFSGMETKH